MSSLTLSLSTIISRERAGEQPALSPRLHSCACVCSPVAANDMRLSRSEVERKRREREWREERREREGAGKEEGEILVASTHSPTLLTT